MSSKPKPARPSDSAVKPPNRGLEDYKPRIAPVPNGRYSRSLEYGVAILEAFAADRLTLRISELADAIGLSRSTTHRYATSPR